MQFLLNLLFPKFCIGCNAIGSYICDDCYKTLNFLIDQPCPYCFTNTTNGFTHERCVRESGISGSYSFLTYKGLTKIFIKDIKYRRIYSVLDDFFDKLPPTIKEKVIYTLQSYAVDYIQPIPLHPSRQRVRGFNQSMLIARQVSALVNIPIIDILERKKNTSAQAKILARPERIRNVNNAFLYTGGTKYKNSRILVIDDLFTTGSTAKEAAKELVAGGISTVYSCTLAHG